MRRILLVPDSLAGVLPAALRQRPSFDVRAVSRPDEVLALTARWPPELVIIGPELGDEDARLLTRRLRADRRLADLRILLISDAVPRGPAGPVVHAELDAHVVGPAQDDLLRAIGVLLDVASRRPTRLPVEVLARVSPTQASDPAADPEPMLANLIALSETSCQIECELPLHIGTVVRIEMALPAGDPLVTQAIVLAADELQLHYGCELLDPDPDSRARIRLFLDDQPRGGA